MLVGNHLALAREMSPNYLPGLLFMSVGRNFSSSGNIKEQEGQEALCQGPKLILSFWLKGREGPRRTLGMKKIMK